MEVEGNAGYIQRYSCISVKICGLLGVSRQTFFRHIRELKEWGMMESSPYKGVDKLVGMDRIVELHSIDNRRLSTIISFEDVKKGKTHFSSVIGMSLIYASVRRNNYVSKLSSIYSPKDKVRIKVVRHPECKPVDEQKMFGKNFWGVSINFMMKALNVSRGKAQRIKEGSKDLPWCSWEQQWEKTGIVVDKGQVLAADAAFVTYVQNLLADSDMVLTKNAFKRSEPYFNDDGLEVCNVLIRRQDCLRINKFMLPNTDLIKSKYLFESALTSEAW